MNVGVCEAINPDVVQVEILEINKSMGMGRVWEI